MDYEKKYKDALGMAEEIIRYYKEHNRGDETSIEDLEQIFPELKESEDERVRKAILELVRQSSEVLDKQNQNNMLAWLEKQGKQKEYTFKSIPRLLDMIEPSDKAKTYCQKLIDTLVKEGYAIDAKIVGECLKTMNGEDVPMAIMDEKQGEYKFEMKSAEESLDIDSETYNKIMDGYIYGEQNPKFKKDDWITNGDYTWKVIKVEQFDYILQSQNGNIVDDTISHVDEQFHSFTIKDAKDGNILVYNNGVVEIILLFKEWKNGCIGAANAYVHMFNNKININNWCDCSYTAHPATKEQCDILFQKMKESGYEWDDEKKELKKIEKKSQRMVSAEAKEALYDKPTDEEMKELLRTEYEKGRADAYCEMYVPTQISPEESLGVSSEKYEDIVATLTQGGQKPAKWSLEDERVIAIINNALTESNTPPDDYDKVYDWLESLRKRIGG